MKVIKMQLYKGLKLLFNEQGEVENQSQSIKLVDGEEWLNYLSFIKSQQLCKVTLISVVETKEGKTIPVTGEHLKLIVEQLKDACKATKDSPVELRLELPKGKTDDEKIKELAGKMGGNDGAKTQKELAAEKKAVRDALKARATAGNLEFRKTMGNDELEKLLIENNL